MLCDGVLRGGTREALLAIIDSTHAGWQRLDLVDAVGRAARIVDAQPLPGREVHVLSDLQRTALASGRADVPRGVRILALEPGSAVTNRGIASVTVSEGAAVIELSGSTPAGRDIPQPVPVTIRIGGARRDRGGGGGGGGGRRNRCAGSRDARRQRWHDAVGGDRVVAGTIPGAGVVAG